MKIAITGTKGIPNEYGGFEQFATNLSLGLVKKGHRVTVYNPDFHSYSHTLYHGVEILKKSNPERIWGSAANFIYDYLCLKDALARKFDIILECGYGSFSFGLWVCNPVRAIVITNMDGMEWQRSKWNGLAKMVLKWSERFVAKKSHAVIADNIHVKKYYEEKYGIASTFIPYGALVFNSENANSEIPAMYGLKNSEYFLVIARFEPENNIEMILSGCCDSPAKEKIVIVGDDRSAYGKYIKKKFCPDNIIYAGNIYDTTLLNHLRYFSKLYFHGHSVGGTNPSLLEAMSAGALVVSHKNIYNESVLGHDAFYFNSSTDIKNIISRYSEMAVRKTEMIKNNLGKIRTFYNWDNVVNGYEELFRKVARGSAGR